MVALISQTFFPVNVDYAESDGEVRFGDLEGCNDPIFIFASYQCSYLLGIRILPRNKARRIKIGTYKVKLSFGVFRSNIMLTTMVDTLTLSANRSITSLWDKI